MSGALVLTDTTFVNRRTSASSTKEERVTLATALKRVDLEAIPNKLVGEHKREALAPYRTGLLWLFVWPVRIIDLLFFAPTFYYVFEFIEHHSSWKKRDRDGNFSLFLFLSLLVSVVSFFAGFPLVAVVVAIPFISSVLLVMWLIVSHITNLRFARATWRRTSLESCEFGTLDLPRMPEHLWDRANKVFGIPGTSVEVEYLDADPFLIAVRGRERVYIGAWETGNDQLDSF